jgi:ribosomal protein L11 methyltransferase
MIYKSVRFKLEPNKAIFCEILLAFLDTYNFEGIIEENDTITGYIPIEDFSLSALNEIKAILKKSDCVLNWNLEDISEQNWNLIWESNFEPVIISNRCLVRAPFHKEDPKIPLEIIIEPKMSFGTGHHQTTKLMIKQMLDLDFNNMKVLDIGCGTGLLSILAAKLGAFEVTAIDIDKWAYQNTIENIEKNSVEKIQVIKGDIDVVPKKKYNIVLANINLNVILSQIAVYSDVTAKGSTILISGILRDNQKIVQEQAEKNYFTLKNIFKHDEWVLMMFKRN